MCCFTAQTVYEIVKERIMLNVRDDFFGALNGSKMQFLQKLS